MNGYTYYDDDTTSVKELSYHYTGGMHLDLVQTRNLSAFGEANTKNESILVVDEKKNLLYESGEKTAVLIGFDAHFPV